MVVRVIGASALKMLVCTSATYSKKSLSRPDIYKLSKYFNIPLLDWMFCVYKYLPLKEGVPDYSRNITCLLMSWFLAALGHQLTWYWICQLDKYHGRTGITQGISMLRSDVECKHRDFIRLFNVSSAKLSVGQGRRSSKSQNTKFKSSDIQ